MNTKEEKNHELRNYDSLLKEVRKKVENFRRSTAKKYVSRMYYALRSQVPNTTPKNARDRIEEDCKDIWTKRTILYALPDEAKDPKKQEAGQLGQKKHNSAAVIAAEWPKKKIVIDTSGNAHNLETTSPSMKPKNDSDSNTTIKNNSDLLNFEFALKFKDVQQFMAQLYPKIGDVGEVWFSGTININNGKIIRAQTGRKKMNNEAPFGFVDRKMGVSHDDDTFDDIDNLI